MLIVISSAFIVCFIVLYSMIQVNINKSKTLAPIIVQTSAKYHKEPKFIHYFISNATIFIAGVKSGHKMMVYSSLYSGSKWIALALAIWNFQQRNWITIICLIGIALFVFLSYSKNWFFHYDEKERIKQTLENWSFFYPGDTDPKNNLLEFPIHILLLDYCSEAVKISEKYFFGNIMERSSESASQKSAPLIYTPQPPFDSMTKPLATNTIAGAINSIAPLPIAYSPKKNDLTIYKLYFALLRERNLTNCGDCENLFVYLFISSMRKYRDTFFDDFNLSNRFFDFSKYNEKQDMIYAENTNGLEYDENYDWLEPNTDEEVTAFIKMEAELEEDDKWSAIMDRELIKKTLDEFLIVRNKIKDLKVSNIAQTIQDNQSAITELEKKKSISSKIIEEEKQRFESMNNAYISMDYSSVNELQMKIDWITRENDMLSLIDKLLSEKK